MTLQYLIIVNSETAEKVPGKEQSLRAWPSFKESKGIALCNSQCHVEDLILFIRPYLLVNKHLWYGNIGGVFCWESCALH